MAGSSTFLTVTEMNAKFGAIEARFASIEEKMDSIDLELQEAKQLAEERHRSLSNQLASLFQLSGLSGSANTSPPPLSTPATVALTTSSVTDKTREQTTLTLKKDLPAVKDKSTLSSVVVNRNMVLQKIDLQIFDGEDAQTWLSLVERFFSLGNYSDDDRLALISLGLSGKICSRYVWEISRARFKDWVVYRAKFLLRFGSCFGSVGKIERDELVAMGKFLTEVMGKSSADSHVSNNEGITDFDLNDGSLRFYIFDAYEEAFSVNMGTIYMFGTVKMGDIYKSCCVVVMNIQRCVYAIPNDSIFPSHELIIHEQEMKDSRLSPKSFRRKLHEMALELKNEIAQERLQLNVSNFSITPVKRNYALERLAGEQCVLKDDVSDIDGLVSDKKVLAEAVEFSSLVSSLRPVESENACLVGLIRRVISFACPVKDPSREIRNEAAYFLQMLCRSSSFTLRMFIVVYVRGLPVLVGFLGAEYVKHREMIHLAIDGMWHVFKLKGFTPRNDLCHIVVKNGILLRLVDTLYSLSELRNLVWATSKHVVYFMNNYSLMHWSSRLQRSKDVVHMAKALVSTMKQPDLLSQALSRIQISTMTVKNDLLVAGGLQGEILCKRINEPKVVFCAKLTSSENNISTCLDGKLVAVLGDSPEGLIVDTRSVKIINRLEGHLDYSLSSAWHPNGQILATSKQDTSCKLWDIRNLSPSLKVFKGNMRAIRALRFTSDVRFLDMSKPADFVHIFDIEAGYTQCQEIDLFGEIAGIPFSPDTEALFVGVANRTYGSLLEFSVGDFVFLKLRPYRQQSLPRRLYQKLATKFYGLCKVIKRIGNVAYHFLLPPTSRIHPVFHISLLKPVLGKHHEVSTLPTYLHDVAELIIVPRCIRETRYDASGHLEVLMEWERLPSHESSWVNIRAFYRQFPSFTLEDKLSFARRVVDMPWSVYVRQRKHKKMDN